MPSVLDVRIDQGLSDLRVPAIRGRLLDTVSRALLDLEEGRVDTVVFAARRMLCLYAVLLGLGLRSPSRGRVVSDRFLETLPDEAWAGRKVLLIDDTRLTGLTLRGRTRTLQRLVGSTGTFETRVALEPPEELSTGAERRAWLDRESGGDLHAQFGALFGRNLIPYFTDFAMSRTVRVPTSALLSLLTRPGWQVAEVTSAAVSGTGARSFSFFPGPEVRARLFAALGPASAAVELVKVRVFTRQIDYETELRVVPIVLTRPFSRDAVEDLLDVLSPGSNPTDAATEQLTGLATYDLSRLVLEAIADDFSDTLRTFVVEDTEHRALVLGDLDQWIGTAWAWTDLVAIDVDHLVTVAPQLIDDGRSLLVGDDSVHRLIEHFSALAEKHPDDVMRERSSLHTLATELDVAVSDLSIALDVGNDLGTVVPSHLVIDRAIYRAYRPGESNDRVESPGPIGGRYASVAETVRLDERFRPIPKLDDGWPRV